MKILISESQLNIIKEVIAGKHYKDRQTERYSSVDEYDVVLHDYNDIVGKYKLADREKNDIDNMINTIENESLRIPINVSAAVVLHRFVINEGRIQFLGDTPEEQNEYRMKYRKSLSRFLYIPDAKIKGKGSTGTYLIMIIYKGTIKTIFLSKYSNSDYLVKKMMSYDPSNRFAVIRPGEDFLEKIGEAKTYDELMSQEQKVTEPIIEPTNINTADKEKELKRQHYLNSLKNKKR